MGGLNRMKTAQSRGSGVFFVILFTLFLINLFFPGIAVSGDQGFLKGLPPGTGQKLVARTCTICHSSAIILQNHMTRKKWDETLTWMQKKQGMGKLSRQDRNKILNYLAKVQGVKGKATSAQKIYDYDYPPNPL